MKNKKLHLLRILGIVYGIIVSLVNFMGFKISSSSEMPMSPSLDLQRWVEFIYIHSVLMNSLMVMTFVGPAIICFCYVYFVPEEKIERRIINIPLAYSIFGALGWIFSYITETIVLIYAKFEINISILSINITSLLNIIQECLFIFITGFLILDAINRKFVLPKFFPEGNLSSYKGTIKISTKGLFNIFYIAVGIFPVFYFTLTLYYKSQEYNFSIFPGIATVVAFILIVGLSILINFSNYFSVPLRKLKKATEQIKLSKYETTVDIVSNDDFGELADNFNEMAHSLDQKTKKILAIQDSVIRGMAVMVESRDNSTGGHINRTSDCVKVFLEAVKEIPDYKYLSDSFYKAMIKAAPMHDLGKIAVDDAILRKPGRFTDEEYEKMKSHSAEGARIVESVLSEVDDEDFKRIAINVAHYHHEKWDGHGYPEKIRGEEIPVEARIMALADVFDALVSKRCYKESMSYDEAFNIIKESLGSHFDPVLGAAFIACRPQLIELYETYNKS